MQVLQVASISNPTLMSLRLIKGHENVIARELRSNLKTRFLVEPVLSGAMRFFPFVSLRVRMTEREGLGMTIFGTNRSYASTFGFLGTSLLLGFVAIGISFKKKRIFLLIVSTILLAGLFIIACGGGGGGAPSPASVADDTVSYTISGLQPSTTYYWKVVADDGKGGQTESDIWSFTTG